MPGASWLGGRLLTGAISVAAIVAAMGFIPSSGTSAGPARRPAVSNCFWELARGTGTELACDYPAWLADQERADLRRITRDMLRDARCNVSIRIERSIVARALKQADYVFAAPPQPVRCELETSDKPITIEATFAPRVVIKDGVAVDATPGLANVTGVNSYLAWPVVEYVNRSATVRNEMLKMINTYLSMRVARRN